jgi:NADH dehydrogenase
LPGFAEDLARYARQALERLGVTVELGRPVSQCTGDGVVFGDQTLAAKTVLWAAGVRASPAAQWLGASADQAGRIIVEPDLSVPGHPDVFAIGDTVSASDSLGRPVPGVAPAAKQEGAHVAAIIRARLAGQPSPGAFRYRHEGSLATIGKRAAIVDFGWIKLRGRIAWWTWGLAHIYFLIGLRNRLSVAMNWLWIYASGQRSARLITQGPDVRSGEP